MHVCPPCASLQRSGELRTGRKRHSQNHSRGAQSPMSVHGYPPPKDSHQVTPGPVLKSLTSIRVRRGRARTAGAMTEEMPSPGPVTRLLLDWSDGDERARDEMLPLVYDELRRLAALYLLRERRDHTLQPTALVHEAYLRLVDQRQVNWKNRAQFVGLAAVMMRRILVNHARDRAAGQARRRHAESSA